MDYQDRVVLVTGGAKGIGRAISRAYLAAGASVIIADIDEVAGRELVRKEKQLPGKADFYRVDLTKAEDVLEMFRALWDKYQKLDILINNAGKSNFKPLTELTVDEWDEILHLNLRAAFITSKEFAKHYKPGDYGRIINIASTRYLMSEPDSEAYAASKGGIVALTHALALSFSSRHMTVNAISPGWIENNHYDTLREEDHIQHPSQRVGRPEDIAKACLFLSEKDNDFLTGQNIIIDGGMTKKMIYLE